MHMLRPGTNHKDDEGPVQFKRDQWKTKCPRDGLTFDMAPKAAGAIVELARVPLNLCSVEAERMNNNSSGPANKIDLIRDDATRRDTKRNETKRHKTTQRDTT